MELAFPKGNETSKRKKRRAQRISQKKVTPEKALQKQANKLYDGLGIRNLRIKDSVFCFINGSPYIPTWFKIFFNTSVRCWADNTLLLKDGRFICIELKSEVGTQSQGQKEFARDVGEDNYYICRTIEEIMDVLKEYKVII